MSENLAPFGPSPAPLRAGNVSGLLTTSIWHFRALMSRKPRNQPPTRAGARARVRAQRAPGGGGGRGYMDKATRTPAHNTPTSHHTTCFWHFGLFPKLHTVHFLAFPLFPEIPKHCPSTCALTRSPIFSPSMSTRTNMQVPWSDRLALDMALMLEGSGDPLDEVLAEHNISHDDLLVFNQDPVFLKRVEDYRSDIREKGLTFRLKARAQAEELLLTSWRMIHDPDVAAPVRADLIKSTVKWAGLEPKNEVVAETGGGGVRITINLGANTASDGQPKVIEGSVSEKSLSAGA